MKKLLFAVKNMNIGGVEKALLSLLNTLSPSEYEVDLLLLENQGGFLDQIPSWVNVIVYDYYEKIKDEVNQPPLAVISRHMKNGRLVRGITLGTAYGVSKLGKDTSHYYKAVFRGAPKLSKKYDVAISYTSIISYLSWIVMYHVDAPVKIGWIHFDVNKLNVDRGLMLKMHRDMDKIYVVSKEALDAFSTKFPELQDKCELKYNVVNVQEIQRLAEDPVENLKEPGVTTIVTLGRLSKEKGQDIIPDVARKLQDAGVRVHWYLVGDGHLRGEIERKIHEYSLDSVVTLLGTKKNPYPYLKQADIYVQTSVHEGYCITLAEAKVFTSNIVATDFAGAREQLNDGVGRVVNRNSDDLFVAIEQML